MSPSRWPSLDPPSQTSRNGKQRTGYVVVLEDLTDLLRAQKQTAWREVARRIAHEIKNPLTPLALSAERIRRHLERGDAARLAHRCASSGSALRPSASSVETVRTLVDEFSTLARFPASKPQPSDINAVVNEALLMFDGRLDGIVVQRFLASDLPAVQADPEAMKRAIANLVDNAAEALHDSLMKQIAISTTLIDSRDSVEIVVADTGHGVTRELKEKLFLPYFSTKGRGTGLGLAIVSRIIEDHHGSIRVEENSPVGARFIVELPLAQEAAWPPPPLKMHTVLIVDDESQIRSALEGVLADEGYKTLLADSGEECLEILRHKSPDVVLLDIWLPGIDGLETLERLVEREDHPEVIMISGHGNIETAVRATKLGAFDFLEKPLSIENTLDRSEERDRSQAPAQREPRIQEAVPGAAASSSATAFR